MAKSTKFTREVKRLTRIWKSRKTVKGKRHVSWGGKRGAFSAIAKAAAKTTAKGTGKRKPAKKKKTSPRKSAAKKKPARKKTRAAGAGKKPAKRKASTAKKRYIVGGKKRAGLMTSTQARALAKRTGKKVKVAATQGAGKRKPKGMSTGAKIGLVALGLVAVGGAAYGVSRAVKASKQGNGTVADQGQEDEF